MHFLNPLRAKSGSQVPPAKTPPKKETTPLEKKKLKEMLLTKENLEALKCGY